METEKRFEINKKPTVYVDKQQVKRSGLKVCEVLKKEGLTYEDAYESLQFAYEQLRYESNYLKLN